MGEGKGGAEGVGGGVGGVGVRRGLCLAVSLMLFFRGVTYVRLRCYRKHCCLYPPSALYCLARTR